MMKETISTFLPIVNVGIRVKPVKSKAANPEIRGCLHDTGATFALERVHSVSLSWLYIFVYMIPPQNVMPVSE